MLLHLAVQAFISTSEIVLVRSMRVLAFCALLLWPSTVCGYNLPEAQRTADAKRWLAVAFIAEAGWADPKHVKAKKDHRGFYHVLKRRWRARVKNQPKWTFTLQVQHYVAAFDPRTKKGTRVRWLLSLQPGSSREPAGWPQKASWSRHSVWWVAAQERAARCIDGGHCPDPYPQAWHWGGFVDIPRECMIPLTNVGTYNTFYAINIPCRRRVIRARRR